MKNWMKRALRTFFETAFGYIATAIALVDFSADGAVVKSTLIGIFTSAIAAGIAAAINYRDDKKFY